MAKWGFYGREAELARLREDLQFDLPRNGRWFEAYLVQGRRGVGKSELVKRAGLLAGKDTPFVTVMIGEDDDAAKCLETLQVRVDEAGHGELLVDMPESHPLKSADWRFADIVAHLIGKGAVVVIDEIQRGLKNGIVGKTATMLDDILGVGGTEPSGKLVLMGSHQQEILRLVGPKGPFFQRLSPTAAPRPWKARTVLEMASEHGLLACPGRLLTLWTAYGGVPRYWRRFVRNRKRLGDFREMSDEDAWRRRFISDEAALLVLAEARISSGSRPG